MQEACMRADFDFLGRPIDLGRQEERGTWQGGASRE